MGTGDQEKGASMPGKGPRGQERGVHEGQERGPGGREMGTGARKGAKARRGSDGGVVITTLCVVREGGMGWAFPSLLQREGWATSLSLSLSRSL